MRADEYKNADRLSAADIGLNRVSVVGSKVRSQSDEDFLRRELEGLDLLGFIPYADSVVDADRNGVSVYKTYPEAALAVKAIYQKIIQ